jgi:tetratricopeptide (TPR) repeat protein
MNRAGFENAVALRDSGRIVDAIREFHRMAEESDNANEKAAILINEHECYCTLGRLKDASNVLVQIRGLHLSNNVVCLIVDYGEACMAIQTGELEQGFAKLNSVLHQHKEHLREAHFRYLYEGIQLRRAFVLTSLRKYNEAFPILKEVCFFETLKAEDRQQVHLSLGICNSDLGRDDAAKAEFLRAIDFGLKNEIEAQARYRAAIIYFTDGAFGQAKIQLELILQSHQDKIPDLPRRYVYEQLSRTCHYLGENENASRYAKLARDSRC